MLWYGMCGFQELGMVWYCIVLWLSEAWYGMVWYGMWLSGAWYGMVWFGITRAMKGVGANSDWSAVNLV